MTALPSGCCLDDTSRHVAKLRVSPATSSFSTGEEGLAQGPAGNTTVPALHGSRRSGGASGGPARPAQAPLARMISPGVLCQTAGKHTECRQASARAVRGGVGRPSIICERSRVAPAAARPSAPQRRLQRTGQQTGIGGSPPRRLREGQQSLEPHRSSPSMPLASAVDAITTESEPGDCTRIRSARGSAATLHLANLRDVAGRQRTRAVASRLAACRSRSTSQWLLPAGVRNTSGCRECCCDDATVPL